MVVRECERRQVGDEACGRMLSQHFWVVKLSDMKIMKKKYIQP